MRLYLLPISTRRTLLYCEKFNQPTTSKKNLTDKVTSRATKLWADWEKKENGWQKSVVRYGNSALRRIPYEEWGLKSVPPLSKKRRDEESSGLEKVKLVYPETAIPTTKAAAMLQTLATERQVLHKSRLLWCFVGMPISAPFALVPVIPNLPFFYLVYRAWSHWRAWAGGKHIQFLISNNLLALAPSPVLDTIYPPPLPSSAPLQSPNAVARGPNEQDKTAPSDDKTTEKEEEEQLLLSQATGKELVKALDLPDLEVEIERAIWQVEKSIREDKEKAVTKGGQPVSPAEKLANKNKKE
ncbi:mitochondrial K+-H+ exchange-related-domain-containing protein [Pseudomassariella vexata]|uniref:Mitochondrial K+-H+ exchange-related-domain-containing protein n=1 Tax=Pseudomassariella vexata TaxID=1141098 RepID=A0A1Y2DVM4_9PEZI|nr:mitochondrial K+-H+ exchange-related-domain-containing protein [Pseudomassariella vexata]ORY63239.1 mitochondrial K+-H+ exchange-related-domain-containing protein [Pseudomassariella vexata]